jgi:DNA polymerase I
MPKKKTFLILDGNALLHRAWHALPPLTTKDGRVVHAAYGFAMVIEKLLESISPEYMAVAWDLPGKTFRHEKFEDYKGTRKKKEPELYDQIPIIQDILDAFDIPSLDAEGFEADDVIGTLAQKMKKDKGVVVKIVTGDLDALQLVDDDTHVLFFQKGISKTKLYDERAVQERYDFEPIQLIDYKALAGDSSDNIPGVPGVGHKTATDIVQKFGSVEKMFVDLKAGKNRELSDRIVQKLLDNKQLALDCKELATIVIDVPIKFKVSDVERGEQNEAELLEMYQDLEFRTLLRKRAQGTEEPKNKRTEEPKKGLKITIVKETKETKSVLTGLSKEQLGVLVGKNKQADLFGQELAVIGLSDGKSTVVLTNPKKEQVKQVLDLVALADQVVVHGYKDLLHEADVLIGVDASKVFDLKIASYLLNSGSRSHDIASVSHQIFGATLANPPEAYAADKDYHSVGQIVSRFPELAKALEKELKDKEIYNVFEEIEMPLVPILWNMEQNGIKLDTKFLDQFSKKLNSRIEQLTKKIHKQADQEFNVRSPIQLAEVLFDKLELPTKGIKKTKKGFSTAAPELVKLMKAHPIIPMINEYRELSKLASTYVDTLPKLVAKDGRIHTSFNQTITATGRLSSSNPNLQNIPIRTELGREIRKAFIADKGKVLIAADYSQIELRVVSIIADDKAFQKAFHEGADIHKRTSAEVLNISEDQVTKDQRRAAKAINFGIIYGMGPHALATSTGLSFSEAQDFIQRYLDTHPAVRDYLDSTKLKAHEEGFVETLFGRRRYFPEINSGVQMLVAQAERMAINMPAQGTAADIMKMSMLAVGEKLKNSETKELKNIKMLLQVHDELVFEVDEKDVEEAAKLIKETMEKVVDLAVPLVVDVDVGENWGDMKRL